MQTGRSDDEPDVVATATTSASGHLLQLRSRQGAPTTSSSCIGAGQNYCARGKVHSGGNCRRSKDRVEQSGAHQFLDHEFPGRDVAGMMRRNTTANDRVPVAVTAHFRMLFEKTAHKVAAC